MNDCGKTIYQFEAFCLDARKRVLTKAGEQIQLTQKCFEVLLVLVRSAGETIEKDALMRAAWTDTIVEEANLIQAVSTLRKILGEKKNEHRFIVTVPGKGYRFVATVEHSDKSREAAELKDSDKINPVFFNGNNSEKLELVSVAETTEAFPLKHESKTANQRRFPRFAIGAAGLALAAILVSIWSFLPFKKSAAHSPEIKSIAVLPFKSLSPETEEYLETGLADALITRISGLQKIKVAPTSAVAKYKGAATDPVLAGKELSADAVLEGNIQKVGERFRISARLLRVSDGIPLWAETFEENSTDIFALQDEISENVTEALMIRLTGEDRKRLTRRATTNTEAYKAFLHGRFFLEKRTGEALKRSAEYFQKAAELDKNFAPAFAGQADAYSLLAYNRYGEQSPAEYFLRAKAASLKALELDNQLAEAHASLGLVYNAFERDTAKSDEHFRRALELNPNYATARQWYAWHFLVQGSTERAVEEMKRAHETEPLSLIITTDLAMFYFYAKDYDAAARTSRKAIELDSAFAPAHLALGLALEQQGNYAEALTELDLAWRSNANTETLAALGHASALAGNTARAQKILGELENLYSKEQASAMNLLTVYASLNDRRQTGKWFLEAKKRKDSLIFQVFVDPRFEALRANLPPLPSQS